MDTLPPELVENICSNLSPRDLKSVRLTSQSLAAAGACHILPQVYLFNRNKSLDELKAIIAHPTFNKHVTTLVCDQVIMHDFGGDFEAWKQSLFLTYRKKWAYYGPYQTVGHDEKVDMRRDCEMCSAKTAYQTACDECPVSLDLAPQMWANHQRLAEEQRSDEFRRSRKDVTVLALASLPKLDRIIIVDGQQWYKKQSHRICTDIWHTHLDTGHRETPLSDFAAVLYDVATAQMSANFKLRHLTVPRCTIHTLRKVEALDFQDLISIRLGLQCRRRSVEWSNIAAKLVKAVHIETLKLNMPSRDFYHDMPISRLRDAYWPSLRILALNGCCMTEDDAVKLISRHKDTLQYLAIEECTLIQGTWNSVFSHIAGRLPSLRVAKIRESLYSCGKEEIYVPGYGNFTSMSGLKLQSFIIKGGVFPEIEHASGKNRDDQDFVDQALGEFTAQDRDQGQDEFYVYFS